VNPFFWVGAGSRMLCGIRALAILPLRAALVRPGLVIALYRQMEKKEPQGLSALFYVLFFFLFFFFPSL